jgi:hypothetical protein
MDDEAKQLLREIRDIALRQENARKRIMRAVALLVVALLCLLAFLTVRLERLMNEVEQGPPSAPKIGTQRADGLKTANSSLFVNGRVHAWNTHTKRSV